MQEKEIIVNVYDKNGLVVVRVAYDSNLDHWDGHNWTCGGRGFHAGLVKLNDGFYMLIYGSEWVGDHNWAEIITADEALQVIIQANKFDLLEEVRFKELKEIYEKKVNDNTLSMWGLKTAKRKEIKRIYEKKYLSNLEENREFYVAGVGIAGDYVISCVDLKTGQEFVLLLNDDENKNEINEIRSGNIYKLSNGKLIVRQLTKLEKQILKKKEE